MWLTRARFYENKRVRFRYGRFNEYNTKYDAVIGRDSFRRWKSDTVARRDNVIREYSTTAMAQRPVNYISGLVMGIYWFRLRPGELQYEYGNFANYVVDKSKSFFDRNICIRIYISSDKFERFECVRVENFETITYELF